MARPKSKTLTLAEQRIMNVLWQKGEASDSWRINIINKPLESID